MADNTLSTMDAVAALMQEREKYEGWLAALESRRAATPPRVYERVSADYRGRLDHVLADIAGRASELEAVSAELRARVQALQNDEESRAEERAEAEIRAAVGEYSPEQWEELRSVADAELAHVSTLLADQRAELERVDGILAIARGPRGAVDAGGTPTQEMEVAAPRVAEPLRGATSGTVTVDPMRADPMPAGPSISVVRADSEPPPDSSEPSVLTPFTLDDESLAASADSGAGTRRATADQSWSEQGANDSAFDDLAFLKSIVEPTVPTSSERNQPTSSPPASSAPQSSTRPVPRGEESRLSTPGRGLAALRSLLGTDDKAGSSARSATGTGGREEQRASAGGREDAAVSGAKTLRCGECGTLNYPTEWYCERCGGELAAM